MKLQEAEEVLQVRINSIQSHSGEKMLAHTKSSSAKYSLFKGNALTFFKLKTGGWAVEWEVQMDEVTRWSNDNL